MDTDLAEPRPRQASGPAGGFSLVELLVVLAVIVVLAAVMLPLIGIVRDSARSVRCMSNLRQLGTCQIAYTQDNNGFTIDGFEDGTWRVLVGPYLDVTQKAATSQATKAGTSVIGDCPAWGGNFNTSSGSAGFGNNSRGIGYAYNAFPGRAAVGGDGGENTYLRDYLGRPLGHPFRLGQIGYPATRLQFFDSDSRMVDAFPSRKVLGDMSKTGGLRHRHGANWLFWDGHVELRWSREMRIYAQRGDDIPASSRSGYYSVDDGAATLYIYGPEQGSEIWQAINRPDR